VNPYPGGAVMLPRIPHFPLVRRQADNGRRIPMRLSQFKVFIFDVNGVLIDSNAANAQAMGRAFSEDPALRDGVARLYLTLTGIDRGNKIRIIQEKVIGRSFAEGEFELRWNGFKRFGLQSMLEAPLTEGSREVLAELGGRGALRAALSNTPLPELNGVLAARGLDSLLDVVRGGGDWPKSESLARLLSELRLDPGGCLFFGDGKGDLAAARHAGVPFVAIDSGTGQFDTEEGFAGPYQSLAHWGREVFGHGI
jgi:phosphoglycolate phosphatase-like HAD superfamily hydrolase